MIIPRRVCQIRPGRVILSGIQPTGIPHVRLYSFFDTEQLT